MKLQHQVAIISGGASGMGEATARFLRQHDCKVALLDKNMDAAKAVADEIGASAFDCDVSDAASVEQAVAAAREVNGPARICVSCAGVAPAKRIVGRDGPMPLDDFAKVININLIGTFNLLRMAAADMMAMEPLAEDAERGVIINTASVAAYEGQIGQSAYSASKGGVVSMTLPAAREFAKFGIRVNTIAPGIIGTPMLLNMPQEVQDSLAQQVPYPTRLGHPEEFAKLAGHIVENTLINGAVMRLDGAIRMQAK